MKSPLQKTRAALKRSRQNLAKLTASKRDATSGLPVFEADTYARSPSESSLTKAKRSDYNLKELSESSESSDEEAGPRIHRKAAAKGRRSWALVLVAAHASNHVVKMLISWHERERTRAAAVNDVRDCAVNATFCEALLAVLLALMKV